MKFREDLPESGSENYLKLKDKETVYGVFRGEVHEYFAIWENKKTLEVPEGTAGSKFRFRVNFIVKSGNTYSAKIFENGTTVYRDLKALNDEYNLEDIVVKMTRNGSGLETTYSLMPILKTPVSAEVKVIKLLPLEHQDRLSPPETPQSDDELPF